MEGYLDVVRLHEFGFNNAVAPCGTALTEQHLQLVKRYADRVILLFDGDDAKSKKVEKIIRENFDLSPRGIREMLSLNKPIYECTAAYGHFGRKPGADGSFSWEKTDKTSVFKK